MSEPTRKGKAYDEPSLFTPEGLLPEARRQKSIPERSVPEVCVLDPDGGIVWELLTSGQARRDGHRACYHTELHVVERDGLHFGIVGGAVGGPFAVLVAEELFASGCELLLSVTSAGQILPAGQPPYFVLIDRAVRDDGTSYHYLPPEEYVEADGDLIERVASLLGNAGLHVERGASWTTDAPFRETPSAIARWRDDGVLTADMEAASLYAFARARGRAVVCFAHVTNTMAQSSGDFEKGASNGALAALDVLVAVGRGLTVRSKTSAPAR